MVDIHCHILHQFDDGSRSLWESLEMARMAADSGVTDLAATPHFPGTAAALESAGAMGERFRQLSGALEDAHIPILLHPGAEILCMEDTPALAKEGLLPTLGDTSYLLTEFRFDESFGHMDDLLRRIHQAGYIPVVAHPERYDAIRRDPLALTSWFRRGYILQLNKGSVLGAFGSRVEHTARVLLDAGLVHVIASDGHTAVRRTPDLSALVRWTERHLHPDYARILLEENPRRILRGDDPIPAD